MGKRRGNKHALRGPIGQVVGLSINHHTTQDEKKLGLQRSRVFAFMPSITVMARAIGNPKVEYEATFSRAIFEHSLGRDLFFRGEPIVQKNRGGQMMSFCVSDKVFKTHTVMEVGASLGEVMEEEG